ncbi:hypothetical protein [Vampirovibrio chlorellavorus]|uniref:hypothetical protein n=1 Tax=Vampirovibrio chlorellavorus TaxID=758823 RepID=UPI0026EE3CAD|nr:hypothetical protein [Vampirovibrio chlorellavorus]
MATVSYHVNAANGYGLQPDPVTGQLPVLPGVPAGSGAQYVDLTGQAYQSASGTPVTPQNLITRMDQGAKTSSTSSTGLALTSELAGATPYVQPSGAWQSKAIPASGFSAVTPAVSGGPSKDEGKAEESRGKSEESRAQRDMPGVQDSGDSPGKAAKEGMQGVKQELVNAGKELMGSPEAGQIQQLTQSLSQQSQQLSQIEKISKQSKMLDKSSKMQDKASTILDKIGMTLEKTGEALSNAGQGMISSGQSMLSNPFTAAAGAALIAAGTALKIAGLAMKAAGKAMQAAAKALAKIAKVLSKIVETLMKVLNKIMDKLNKVLGNISKRLKDLLNRVRAKLKLNGAGGGNSLEAGKGMGSKLSPGGAKPSAKVEAAADVKAPGKKVEPAGKPGQGKAQSAPDEESSGGFGSFVKETATDLAINQAVNMGTQALSNKMSGRATAGSADEMVDAAQASMAPAIPLPGMGLPMPSAGGFTATSQQSVLPAVGGAFPIPGAGFGPQSFPQPFQPPIRQVG